MISFVMLGGEETSEELVPWYLELDIKINWREKNIV